jgi:hypothetical protein
MKGLGQRYLPGARGWFEVRRRQTTGTVLGGVTGTLRRPQLLVLGRYDADGRLRPVGRTTPLKPDAARRLADHLTEAGPDHPWTGVRCTASWGSRESLDPILVVPDLVAEISADTAIDRGAWRHPLRFVWLRLAITGRRAAVRGRLPTLQRLRESSPAPVWPARASMGDDRVPTPGCIAKGTAVGAGRSRTVATVVRVGPRTTLVTVSGWHHGQILAPVETWILTVAPGRSLAALPGTRLWVTARLDALLDTDLALQDWEIA